MVDNQSSHCLLPTPAYSCECMCCGEVDIGVSLSGVLLACLPACLLVTGIPLLYLALLFASRAKIRARDVSANANVVNMLCQDYTVAYWCVETISHCITSHHTTPHHITPDAQCWWCGGSDIILYYILCGVAVCCTVCPSFVLRLLSVCPVCIAGTSKWWIRSIECR